MQNRRDQAQAHAFVMGRLVSALLRADPDGQMTPLRRFLVGSLVGVILSSIVLIGFGVYGFFVPGGSGAWRKPGMLVLEKETGSKYVLVDGVLRPVLNYASARLILGGAPKVVSVSRNSLREAPRGLPVGIIGAPDYLPDRTALDGKWWQVCSAVRPGPTGADQPHVVLSVAAAAGWQDAPANQALLVRTVGSQIFLIAGGKRLRVPNAATAAALGYSAAAVSLVGLAWINAVPAGPDLIGMDIPYRGTAGPRIDGRSTVVGQLFRVLAIDAGAQEQFFVMRRDGLSALTSLGAALMLADPATRVAYPGQKAVLLELSRATLAQVTQSPVSAVNEALPSKPPTLVQVGAGLAPCLGFTMTSSGPTIHIGVSVPGTGPAAAAGGGADQITVAPGIGLLARTQPAPDLAVGTLYLVVDTGVRYPIPTVEAATALGYRAADALPIPAPILELLPAGRPLDPQAAKATVAAAAATPSITQ